MTLPKLTIGIEEEYQIIDPKPGADLVRPGVPGSGPIVLGEQIKPELLQSQVEVGSQICQNMKEARPRVVRLRSQICELAAANGLAVGAASTHPFSSWKTRSHAERALHEHIEQMADVARRMLIFGMHVHIGIDDRELMMDVMDQARYFLPHLLALSTSSPFWHGRDTGLKSYRSIVFERLPAQGPPPAFESWAEHQGFVETLVKTKLHRRCHSIWWDIRPHPKFPTLEFRVCDICTKVDESDLSGRADPGDRRQAHQAAPAKPSWRRYRHHLIRENKWRAVRYGIDGKTDRLRPAGGEYL